MLDSRNSMLYQIQVRISINIDPAIDEKLFRLVYETAFTSVVTKGNANRIHSSFRVHLIECCHRSV